MANGRLVLCGRLPRPAGTGGGPAEPLHLRIGRGHRDVHLRVEHLSRSLAGHIEPVAIDLLELSAYVYAADQVVSRGGTRTFEYGAAWRRHFRFELPVRRPDVWTRGDVRDALTSALGFLTDDHYEFGFHHHPDPPPAEGYLFRDTPDGPSDCQEVLLFSGGLDSLAGAVREVLGDRRPVALVSHQPVSKIHRRQQDLVQALRERAAGRVFRPRHVGLVVNKGKALGREFTQRSRSFLFVAVAATVARAFGLRRVRFYENGVTSMNLPLSPQVVGGRASRTTHPRVLDRFERLLTLLFGPFEVDNPFLWRTKAQLLGDLRAQGHADLCRLACSCVHTWEQRRDHPHCGRCSQCVDRRLAALAAGLREEDPRAGYAHDVLVGPRDGPDLTLVERYVGVAREVDGMESPTAFAVAYPEVLRTVRHTRLAADEAVREAFALHKAHAAAVLGGLEAAYQIYAPELARGQCPPNSMLAMAVGIPAPPSRLVQPSAQSSELRADRETFTIACGANECPLGNTLEFQVAEYLIGRFGSYISLDELRDEVWRDDQVAKNTIQKTVGNLRRRLSGAGVTGFVIDGNQRGHYRLTPAGPVSRLT